MLRASDRRVAAPSLSFVRQQSPPFALGASQRMVLSTASGKGGETEKEGGKAAAVHGTQDVDAGASATDPRVRVRGQCSSRMLSNYIRYMLL